MKTVDNIMCDKLTWVQKVMERYPEAEIKREGNWTWATLDGEDIAMHSVILCGGWIKNTQRT